MKAIKIIVMNLALIGLISGCKSKDQEQHDLDPSTKAYFDIKNGSTFVFADLADSNSTSVYTSGNYLTGRANPDIENSEYITYDLNASADPSFSIRCQSGGMTYKDQIALITKIGGTTYIGPVVFNLGDNFTTGVNSSDTIYKLPSITFNNRTYTNVYKVIPYSNVLYSEVYFAKGIGFLARREKATGKLFYVKTYSVK